MPDSGLSARYAFLCFAFGAWVFAAVSIALGCVTGSIDTGPEYAELWRKALYVSFLTLAAAIPATIWGAIYAAWLRFRRFSTRWRQARIVPLSAGFFSWVLMFTIYTPIFIAVVNPTEPTGSFLANYSYLAVIPLVPLVLAEASFRLFKAIDVDIPAVSQGDELP